jgi:hypothetical protein
MSTLTAHLSMTAPAPTIDRSAPWRRAALLLAGAWAAYGLLAMLLLSPRVPYADPYRFLARLCREPFPANVLASDNGHREVLPNLVRLAELHWLHANQWLQIGLGVVLAVVVAALAARATRGLAAGPRAAALAVLAVGLFWLGNGRKLAHGNESVHLFLVLAFLLLGLQRLAAASPDRRASAAAAALALLATFSFGSGLACFPAFAVVLWLRRAPLAAYGPLGGGAALALLGIWSADTRGASLAGSLADRADLLLRWIGAPSAWAFSPLLDPAHAARQPFAWLRAVLEPVAGAASDAFGPHLAARWPALAFGALAALWLLAASLWCRRRPANAVEVLALGVAWFGVAVGGLVIALRTSYFHAHPEQITTQRYVPWSMLVWTGLGVAASARATRPRLAIGAALGFAALLAPSQVWTTRYAWKQRDVAERTAVAAAVGVLDAGFALEETEEADLRTALPLLRDRGAAMFAWPEVPFLLQPLPSTAVPVAIAGVAVRPVENRLGAAGCEVEFEAAAPGAQRLLLAAADGIVRGLAIRRPLTDRWFGVVRGSLDAAEARAAMLR